MGRENTNADSAKLAPYFELLDRVLEDRLVDEAESAALYELAARWELTGQEVCAAHRKYLTDLASAAVGDGIVTEAERRDLEDVAHMLGFDIVTLESLLTEPAIPDVSEINNFGAPNVSLDGKTVCFTGQSQCKFNGKTITRDLAEQLASRAGLKISERVTKALDILVVNDPHSQSTKARKAREYGTRIMAEAVFWRSLGINVE